MTGFAGQETMATRPERGGTSSAARDVANLGLVRPPLIYLTSLISGALIHLAMPLPFLPGTLAVPLGAPLVAVAIGCSLTRWRNSGQPALPCLPESPPP